MAVSFPRLPRWLCGRGGGNSSKEREKELVSKGNFLNPSSDSSRGPHKKTKSSTRKTKRGWLGKDEERIGNVVFPEPDGPEWSIGWVEPHGPGFKADDDDDEGDNGFVVLVPCYKKVMDNSRNLLLGAINGLPNGFSPDGKNMEEWLSSLQKL